MQNEEKDQEVVNGERKRRGMNQGNQVKQVKQLINEWEREGKGRPAPATARQSRVRCGAVMLGLQLLLVDLVGVARELFS
jgi:hypothetical protein